MLEVAELKLETPKLLPPAPLAGLRQLSTAELAECTCPDYCERDHDRD